MENLVNAVNAELFPVLFFCLKHFKMFVNTENKA